MPITPNNFSRASGLFQLGLWLFLASGLDLKAEGLIEVVTNRPPLRLFSGGERSVPIKLHNPGNETAAAGLKVKLFQGSTATAAAVESHSWKQIQILPHQTIVESAAINFPTVRGETPFLIQWADVSNRILGLSLIHI